ncbi:hypothetical protein U1Q18_039250, partial [Sarracenia purpurea var. burkii]
AAEYESGSDQASCAGGVTQGAQRRACARWATQRAEIDGTGAALGRLQATSTWL